MQSHRLSTARNVRQKGTRGNSSETKPASSTKLGMTDLERRWLLGLRPPEAALPETATVAIEHEEAAAIVIEPVAPPGSKAIVPAMTAPPLAIEPVTPPRAAPASPTIPEVYRVVVACCSSPSSAPIDQPDEEGRPGI